MLLLFVAMYNILFFSYFLLENARSSQEVRDTQKMRSKNVVMDVAKSLKIGVHRGNEKKIAQLVKKKLNELYKK